MPIKIKVQATCDICPKRSTRSGDTVSEAVNKLATAGWFIGNTLFFCPPCTKRLKEMDDKERREILYTIP